VEEFFVGILALVVGAVFCFRGYVAMRIVIPIWGFFAGFTLGAGAVSALDNTEFLGTLLGWFLGFFLGLMFAVIAYLYYEVAVVLAFASIGFMLGSGFMTAINVDWNWLVVLVGVAVGILLAVFAITAELPMVLLVVLSTMAGALAMTGGMMLLFNAIETENLNSDSVVSLIDDDWWWWAIAIGLMLMGLLAQMSMIAKMHWSTRAAWDNSPSASSVRG
jgi:hypothetical protein